MEGEINGSVYFIFIRDLEDFMQYLNKQVSVFKEDGKEVIGWVYIIDLVLESFVLLFFIDDKIQLDIVMGLSVR